jgi:N-acetylglutamate synthase-like GNAT family acetyltransferase
MVESQTPSFVAASAADLPAIRKLLTDARLPVADLADSTPIRFWLVRDHGRLVGTIALERFGSAAMLRSLAVSPDHQGTGLGRALLRHAERCALAEGIGVLCLLTTTAADLFDRHGYERIPRSNAPAEVQHSEEFRSLCPDSAVCMLKRL